MCLAAEVHPIGVQVKEIMNQSFTTVKETDSALEIPRLLTDYNISMLPVVDWRNRLVGVVSRGDFLRYCLPNYVKFMNTVLYLEEGSILSDIGRAAREATVADLMTRRVVTLFENDTVCRAIAVLLGQNLNQVPVLKENQIVGLVGRNDVVRLVGRMSIGQTTPTC